MRLAALLLVDGIEIVAHVSPQGDRFWPALDRNGQPFPTMLDLIRRQAELLPAPEDAGRAIADAAIRAPLIPARNIMCVGKNYADHAREFAGTGFDTSTPASADPVPTAPIIFTKAPETVIGPGDVIQVPHQLTAQADYEAELGVIIGKGGRGIGKGQALDHVFGYTILNDVTARDIQHRHKQWFLGKSIDTFCPMGPWIVTADEVDSSALAIKCWVNGELRQNASTADLIFGIPTLIETISAGMALKPGDVIATGTPAGVGAGFNPPRFLARGDEVTIEIEGLGQLRNPVG